MRKTALFCGLVALCATMASGQVVINELRNGTPNIWLGIANLGAAPVALDNYRVQGYWDNPADNVPEIDFTFPVGTTLNPGEECVLEEVAGNSPSPVGTQTFALAAAVPWFLGLPLSIVLVDNLGNGLDYIACGSVNQLDAPFELGVAQGQPGPGVPTTWATGGTGAPVLGGVPFGFNSAMMYRHARVDTDGPDDWTNTAVLTNATPGALNHFQNDVLSAACTGAVATPPTVNFAASNTAGCPPVFCGFTNTSTGICEINLGFGAASTWDFDTANPGTDLASTWHAAKTFLAPRNVTLTVVDVWGNSVTSATTPINVTGGGTPTPVNLPFRETFETGFDTAQLVFNSCTNNNGPAASTGWENFRTGNGRFRVRDLVAVPLLYNGTTTPVATSGEGTGPKVLILDSVNTADLTRLVLHFDGTQGGGNGFRFQFKMLENFDELHLQDTVFLQDGVTAGNRVNRDGTFAAIPGHNGFREMLVSDWNGTLDTTVGSRIWRQFDITITYAQIAAAGLTISADMTLGIQQFDNVTFEGNDGLMVDDVRVMPDPPNTFGLGQPCTPGQAGFDVNSALNTNLLGVNDPADLTGPYTANVYGGSLAMTMFGQPNQPVIFVMGTPSVGAAFYGAAGNLDLAGAQVVSDGLGQTGFLPYGFILGANGVRELTLTTGAAVPPGTVLGMQCAMLLNVAPFVKISNAVFVTF